jgi:hypothetical protein
MRTTSGAAECRAQIAVIVLACLDVGGLILWLCNQLVHTSSRATAPKNSPMPMI